MSNPFKQTQLSIFTRLEKYAHRQEENFFTEALVGFLKNDPKQLSHLLLNIFPKLVLENPAIDTQKRVYESPRRKARQREPQVDQFDIIIKSNSKMSPEVVIIENKIGSPAHNGQLEKYSKSLNSKEYEGYNKFLILVTKRWEMKLTPSVGEVHFKQIRWYEIYDLIKIYSSKLNNSDIRKEFLNFMKGKNMSMDSKKVSLDLISGSKQVYNFISQLEKAAGHMNLNPQKYRGKKTSDPASSFEDKYIGYWLHIKQKKWIWCGMFFNAPRKLIFEFKDLSPKDAKNIHIKKIPIEDTGFYGFAMIYELSTSYFKATMDEQVNQLAEWISDVEEKVELLYARK